VLAKVRTNQKLLVQAWDRGEQQLLAEGELHSLDNQIDVATGTVKLKARFANAGEGLFPNQFVNVRLRVETRNQATLIPSAAVQFGARGTFVFVLGADDKVQLRDIKVAASDGATSLIDSGVKVGERLVLEGTDKLKEGSQVQVIGNEPGALAQPQGQASQKQGA
jgi:multidrug efflux system membrane fusion protein